MINTRERKWTAQASSVAVAVTLSGDVKDARDN